MAVLHQNMEKPLHWRGIEDSYCHCYYVYVYNFTFSWVFKSQY